MKTPIEKYNAVRLPETSQHLIVSQRCHSIHAVIDAAQCSGVPSCPGLFYESNKHQGQFRV